MAFRARQHAAPENDLAEADLAAPIVDAPEEEEEGELAAPPGAEDADDYSPDAGLGAGDPGAPLLRYKGEGGLPGLPSREELVARDADLRRKVFEKACKGDPLLFMPNDVEEHNEYGKKWGSAGEYVLRLYGALLDGSKASVTLQGIVPFFDVAVPEGPSEHAFDGHLATLLQSFGVRIEAHLARPVRGYHPTPCAYRRVYTNTLQQRKSAIAAVRNEGHVIASDDASCYYRKAARELGLPLTQWAILRNYEYLGDAHLQCAHAFTLRVGDYTAAPPLPADAPPNPLLARDRTLVAAWDIETFNGRGTGELPTPENPEDVIFMACITAHWKDDPEPLARVCFVDVETAPDPRWITVVCGNQRNVLRGLILGFKALAPDIIVGFNDTGYDWPFVAEKLRQEELLGWAVDQLAAGPPRRAPTTDTRWNYRVKQRIKISAEESAEASYIKVPGFVPIDARIVFRKIFPKSEAPKAGSSLRHYLGLVGLPGKADMPIGRMWRIYRGAREAADLRWAEEMRHVAYYCMVDAVRCQELLVRRGVVNDYREVSSLAFVSFADSHFTAGGMKVCNLLGARATRRGLLVSMARPEQKPGGKYSGAYVFDPDKGIVPNPGRMANVDAAAAAYRTALEAARKFPELQTLIDEGLVQ